MWTEIHRKYLLITSIFLFLVGIASLSAGIRSADGTGYTLEEAKLTAQLELASQLSIKVSSQQRLMSSEHITSKKNTNEELLYQDTNILVDLELLGVRYKNQKIENNEITITAYIDESSLSQYLQKLSTIKRNIDEIEQRNSQEMSLETQKANLLVLLRYYERFEAYSTIASALKNDVELPRLQKTKAGAELDYIYVLNTEVNLLQTNLKELQSVSDISISNTTAQQEAKIKMQEIAQKLAANQQAMQSWQLEQKQRQQELSQLSNESIQINVQAMNDRAENIRATIIPKSLGNDPFQFIRKLEEEKQTYLNIQKDLEFVIMKQFNPIQARFKEEIQALELTPYRAAEMVNGKATAEAKGLRDQKIEMLRIKMNNAIGEGQNLLEESIEDQQKDFLESIFKGYRNLEGKSFILKTLQDDISLKVGTYDGYRKSWPVAIRFLILGNQFAFDMYIPYETMTGNILPNFSIQTNAEQDAYNMYLDQVDLFETYFLSAKVPLLVEITYKIKIGENPSEYEIIPILSNLFRSDEGSNIFSYAADEPQSIAKFYRYNPITDIQTEKKYFYEKELQETQNLEKEKLKAINRKERQAKLKESALYYRGGFVGSLGLALQPVDFSASTSLGPSFSLGAYYTPYNNMYIGLSADGSSVINFKTLKIAGGTLGIYPLVGFILPLGKNSDGSFIKAYGDLRFGFSYNSLVSILNIGFVLNNLLELSCKVQLNGENVGLINFSLGFDLVYLFLKK